MMKIFGKDDKKKGKTPRGIAFAPGEKDDKDASKREKKEKKDKKGKTNLKKEREELHAKKINDMMEKQKAGHTKTIRITNINLEIDSDEDTDRSSGSGGSTPSRDILTSLKGEMDKKSETARAEYLKQIASNMFEAMGLDDEAQAPEATIHRKSAAVKALFGNPNTPAKPAGSSTSILDAGFFAQPATPSLSPRPLNPDPNPTLISIAPLKNHVDRSLTPRDKSSHRRSASVTLPLKPTEEPVPGMSRRSGAPNPSPLQKEPSINKETLVANTSNSAVNQSLRESRENVNNGLQPPNPSASKSKPNPAVSLPLISLKKAESDAGIKLASPRKASEPTTLLADSLKRGKQGSSTARDIQIEGKDIDILELIGKGATATVWKGRIDGNIYALKQIPLLDHNRQKKRQKRNHLQAEVDLLKTLHHPNIIKYIGSFFDKDASEVNLVLELIEGTSVAKLAECKDGKIEEPIAATIITQLLSALIFLKSHRILHRDVKPDNLLVNVEGEIKLIDFGICAQLKAGAEFRCSAVGTPWYVAPEVILGDTYSYPSDIWSVGCSVTELITGHPPYHNLNAVAALHAMLEEDPPMPPSASDTCKAFLSKCLVRAWKQRADAVQLMNHPWIKQAAPQAELAKLVRYSQLMNSLQ